jgi:hypothetical protein
MRGDVEMTDTQLEHRLDQPGSTTSLYAAIETSTAEPDAAGQDTAEVDLRDHAAFLSRSAKRIANAMAVKVGLAKLELGKTAAPAT